jgi:hypothetical protein
MRYGVTPSTLGLPGDAATADDCARPRRLGAAAGVRGAESVLGGHAPRPREREAAPVTGSDLARAGFPLTGSR